MFEIIVTVAVLAYLAWKEYIWHNKEIDLVDRAIPHTTEEKRRQDIHLMVVQEMEKMRPRRGPKPKGKKGKVEKVGELGEGEPGTHTPEPF